MTSRESNRPASRLGRWFLPGRWQCIARGSVGSPPLIGSSWATANGGRHKAMRPGRGVAEWHMLPSWNSLHTLLVARAVLLWHGASYPVLRCSSLARHPDLGPPTVPCARRPLFWYPIPARIGSPTGDAWLTCQCASQSACSATPSPRLRLHQPTSLRPRRQDHRPEDRRRHPRDAHPLRHRVPAHE